MDNISLDSENPFLYVAAAATISTCLNLYCCLRYCRNRKHTNNNRISNQEDIELTSEFTNIVLPRLPEQEEEQSAATTSPPTQTTQTEQRHETQTNYIENHIIDIETGATTTKKTSTDMTTQTEDCELYEMMGERFTQELEYYKMMNMNKNKSIKI